MGHAGYLSPTLDQLSVVHNFSIETQVQYHAPLAFQPTLLAGAENSAQGLDPDQLKTFVNSAEWTLGKLRQNNNTRFLYSTDLPSFERQQ